MLKNVNLLQGTLIFGQNPKLTPKSKIKLIIEDISFADSQAARIAEQEIDFDASEISLFKSLEFKFRDFVLKKGRDYSLAVHVDIDGDGKITEGDFITTQTYPVIPNEDQVVTGTEHYALDLTRL